MKDKLDRFIANINGQFVEVSDRTNVYQCMDLAYLWIFCLGFPKETISHLYAYQVYTQPSDLTRQYFDLIPNTSTFIPQDGDVTVFDRTSSNVAGHIGVALRGGTISWFNNFEQNWPIGTNAAIRSRNYNTPKLLGVLRPKPEKVFPSLSITDQTKIPQIIDSNGNQMEVQAIRGLLSDKNMIINSQQEKINNARNILSS
jgi:hypothetical protein